MGNAAETVSTAIAVVLRVAVNMIGLGLAAILFRHVSVDSFTTLLIAGIVLSICNMIVKPILTFLSIPFLVLTLGLFYIVISGLVIMLTSWLVKGFLVDGLWVAIGVSFVVGLINLVFDMLYTKKHYYDDGFPL